MIQLSWWEKFIVGAAVSFLTIIKTLGKSFVASEWEQLVIGLALSFLTLLQSKLKNATELAALASVIAFLQALLMGGGSIEADAVQAAIAFLNQLLAGQIGAPAA